MSEKAASVDDVVNECLALRSRMAARSVTRRFDEALRPLKLRVTQFTLLVAIEKSEQVSMSALADWLAMERTTLIRNIELLEKEGLVQLGPEGYRRIRSVDLTAKGRQVLEEALPVWQSVQEQLVGAVGGEDAAVLRRLLERLARV